MHLSQVTKPKVERLCSLEGSVSHLTAREAVQCLGFLTLFWDASPSPDVRQTDVSHSLSPGEGTLFVVERGPEKVSVSFLNATEVMGHDDFTRNVIYAPLPKRHLAAGKPFLCGA